jgi:IS1 family transposase
LNHNAVINWVREDVQGKAHTFPIESHNNRLRCCLARLRRKTHCYTKKLANLAASILFYIINS